MRIKEGETKYLYLHSAENIQTKTHLTMLSSNIERHQYTRWQCIWYIAYICIQKYHHRAYGRHSLRWLYLHSRTHYAALTDNNKTLRHISCKSFRRFDTCHHLFYVRVPYMYVQCFMWLFRECRRLSVVVCQHFDVVAVTMAVKTRLHTQVTVSSLNREM